MMTTYYRIHSNPQAPCFCAAHAYSAPWGGQWSPDGTATTCTRCDGTGTEVGSDETCRTCGGEGSDLAERGYSACESAQALAAYVAEHVGAVDNEDPVVVFEGKQVGTGWDGEPLVVPTGEVRWTTWGQL